MPSPSRYSANKARAYLIMAAVSLEFGSPHLNVISRGKGCSKSSFIRQISMYLLHTVFEANFSQIARVFLRDRSTVTHACHVIEDAREDPLFDQKLERLEKFLRHTPSI